MKTKEQELEMFGLKEINSFEKIEIEGGRLYPWNDDSIDTLGIITVII